MLRERPAEVAGGDGGTVSTRPTVACTSASFGSVDAGQRRAYERTQVTVGGHGCERSGRVRRPTAGVARDRGRATRPGRRSLAWPLATGHCPRMIPPSYSLLTPHRSHPFVRTSSRP